MRGSEERERERESFGYGDGEEGGTVGKVYIEGNFECKGRQM